MTNQLEDTIGKSVIAAIFAYLAIVQAQSILTVLVHRDSIDLWPFVLLGRIAGLAFLCLIVVLTVLRHQPKNISGGLEPRLTSIAGTFCLMLLVVLPTGDPGAAIGALASVLMVVGTILSIWCAIYLGRSFSVMAAARALVVEGPYARVRHPLYAAESLTMLGSVIAAWSMWSGLLGLMWCALQYRRMLNEERVLRATFPEYEDYVARVPMIVPSLFPVQETSLGVHTPK